MLPIAILACLAIIGVIGAAMILQELLRKRGAKLATRHRLLREAALAKGFDIEDVPARVVPAHVRLRLRSKADH